MFFEAPGYDKILNKVLKTGKDIIKGHLLELFNRILSSGKYPTLWSFGLIVPIHNQRKTIVNSWVLCLENNQLVITSGFPIVNFRK